MYEVVLGDKSRSIYKKSFLRSRIVFLAFLTLSLLVSFSAVGYAQLLPGNFVVADQNAAIFEVTPAGVVTTFVSGLPLVYPWGLVIDPAGNLIVTDPGAGAIFRITPDGTVTTVYSGAPLTVPFGVAVNNAGNYIVTDIGSDEIYRLTPAGVLTTVTSAVSGPWGVDVDGSGDYIVVGNGDDSIYRVTPAGTVTLIATDPAFDFLQGLHIDANGNYIVADEVGSEIFEVTPAGVVTLIYGGAPLGDPGEGVSTDNGDIIIPDDSSTSGNAIFRLTPGGSPVLIVSGAPFTDLNGLTVVPQAEAPTAVPTMTEWGMIIFMVLAGLGSLYYLRRQRYSGE